MRLKIFQFSNKKTQPPISIANTFVPLVDRGWFENLVKTRAKRVTDKELTDEAEKRERANNGARVIYTETTFDDVDDDAQ